VAAVIGTVLSNPMGSSAQLVGPTRHRLWTTVAALLAVLGIVATLVAAVYVARGDASSSRQDLARSSANIAVTLQLAINDEESLVVNASAFVLEDPGASNAQFARWLTEVQAFERNPAVMGLGESVIVPSAKLATFSENAVGDPAGSLGPDNAFFVIPPGTRPYYCLAVLSQSRVGERAQPAGFDFCAAPAQSRQFLGARDSGLGSYQPITVPGNTWLGAVVPIYRGGVVPATVDARRGAFVGWFGMFLNQTLVIDRALQGHKGLLVSMRFGTGSSRVTFSAGKAPQGTRSVTTDLANGWTMRTSGAVLAGTVWANPNALAVLLAGVTLSLLLALLVLVLATGRARALVMVEERTGELRHQALHDSLTGLPNRALIMDRIGQLMTRNRRNGTNGSVLFVDLDDFKNVNDTLGHDAGDQLLVAVAARLESTLRDTDTVGRMSGDEFIVLIDGGELAVAPELVASRLLDVMRQPFRLEGVTLPLTVNTSIGIASGGRTLPSEMLSDADMALYQAKADGKNRYQIFRPEMQTVLNHRMELELALRSALAADEFTLVYQPIYNLDDRRLVGVEALLRWEHPTLGPLLPDEFIPVLEQTGEIREVGRWVLRQACEQMARWQSRGETLDLSVNISARQLDDDAIVGNIGDALSASGLAATSLIVEVTETALMHNPDDIARRLQSIKALGVRIAVDDFGTGYSSLTYLRQFPVDCLKIDRGFMTAISASPESKALLSTLIQLGKDLGLATLAEGVETLKQMAEVQHGGVDYVQGFLFARPLAPEALEAQFLIAGRPGAPTEAPARQPAEHPSGDAGLLSLAERAGQSHL
jgi:diguanylate cyclase (GGDEF)-like protein